MMRIKLMILLGFSHKKNTNNFIADDIQETTLNSPSMTHEFKLNFSERIHFTYDLNIYDSFFSILFFLSQKMDIEIKKEDVPNWLFISLFHTQHITHPRRIFVRKKLSESEKKFVENTRRGEKLREQEKRKLKS